MTGEEFASLIRAATLASITRTAARSPAAAAYARRELEEITQAAALGALERIDRGDAGDLAQIAARAANVAIVQAWRDVSDPRITPLERTTEDGEIISALETLQSTAARRGPEDAAEAEDMIHYIIGLMPTAYRQDAPRVLRWTAAGYTAEEIASILGGSARRVRRILHAARDAAREEARTA